MEAGDGLPLEAWGASTAQPKDRDGTALTDTRCQPTFLRFFPFAVAHTRRM